MKTIKRRFDIKALVNELGNNKIVVLEVLREALSNAKDHKANRLFLRVRRDNQGVVSVILIDNGEGLDDARWEAFWGAATSVKSSVSIGYKGFGTKLFFQCEKLSVASRASIKEPWILVSVDRPYQDESGTYQGVNLADNHELTRSLKETGVFPGTGTAIWIDDLRFTDKDHLLSRQRIHSYCDWSTIIGDIRSGLFDTRKEFHLSIKSGGAALDGLQTTEVPLRPIEVLLKLNGDTQYQPLGSKTAEDRRFFAPWAEDVKEFDSAPAILAFGHRFADTYVAGVGKGGQKKDDRTALRLTGPGDWIDENGIAIVAHVEGQRRQRETYLEARWQGKQGGLYTFDDQFGLWLCKDFVPVVQRNDLLKRALAESDPRSLDKDFKSLRNWKVFINDQGFLPIANRGDVSNYIERESKLYNALLLLLRRAFTHADFADWLEKLRSARRERERDYERSFMERRRLSVSEWVRKGSPDGIDPTAVSLAPRDPDDALRMRSPENEQELFYLYAQLSARFEVPLMVLEYDTHSGVDAIGRVRVRGLLPADVTYARIEFKFEVEQGYPIGHYFEAIDIIICWRVGRTGDIDEEGAVGMGKLRKRQKSVLTPSFDTHEIVYTTPTGVERTIPVLQLKALFDGTTKKQATKRGRS